MKESGGVLGIVDHADERERLRVRAKQHVLPIVESDAVLDDAARPPPKVFACSNSVTGTPADASVTAGGAPCPARRR